MAKQIILIGLFLLLLSSIVSMMWVKAADDRPQAQVTASWAKNYVNVDGKITSPSEWSEATYTDTIIGYQWATQPPMANMRVWTKNDQNYLYMLCRISAPSDVDINDEFAIHYYWPIYDGVWAHGDKGYVSLNGYSGDQYILDGVLGDDVASGGQNNFLAKGMISGGYYWFEFRKDLNSGDGYDWALSPGQTIGVLPTQDGDAFTIGYWDTSQGLDLTTHMKLTLASPPNIIPRERVVFRSAGILCSYADPKQVTAKVLGGIWGIVVKTDGGSYDVDVSGGYYELNVVEENPGTVDHMVFKSLTPNYVTLGRDHVTIVGHLMVEKHGWVSPGVPFTRTSDWGVVAFQIYRGKMTIELYPPGDQYAIWNIVGRTLSFK